MKEKHDYQSSFKKNNGIKYDNQKNIIKDESESKTEGDNDRFYFTEDEINDEIDEINENLCVHKDGFVHKK